MTTSDPTISDGPVQGARARARAEVRAAILATASAHLAAGGPASLSLRAVARDLGMVSSAVYRYFSSRDELLTALIIEAYDALGECAETAVAASAGKPPATRWVDTALAVRTWAVTRPHDYALLYGTPVPGYAAPDDTVTPGTRVSTALVGIVSDAVREGGVTPSPLAATIGEGNRASFDALRAELDLEVTDALLLDVLLAWTQLFGLLSFEIFGQTRNFVADDELLFRDAALAMARRIGLAEG